MVEPKKTEDAGFYHFAGLAELVITMDPGILKALGIDRKIDIQFTNPFLQGDGNAEKGYDFTIQKMRGIGNAECWLNVQYRKVDGTKSSERFRIDETLYKKLADYHGELLKAAEAFKSIKGRDIIKEMGLKQKVEILGSDLCKLLLPAIEKEFEKVKALSAQSTGARRKLPA